MVSCSWMKDEFRRSLRFLIARSKWVSHFLKNPSSVMLAKLIAGMISRIFHMTWSLWLGDGSWGRDEQDSVLKTNFRSRGWALGRDMGNEGVPYSDSTRSSVVTGSSGRLTLGVPTPSDPSSVLTGVRIQSKSNGTCAKSPGLSLPPLYNLLSMAGLVICGCPQSEDDEDN